MDKANFRRDGPPVYRYIFRDGYTEYSKHLGVEVKEELEEIHGKLILKTEARDGVEYWQGSIGREATNNHEGQ